MANLRELHDRNSAAPAVELADDPSVTAQELAVRLLTDAALKCLAADSVRAPGPKYARGLINGTPPVDTTVPVVRLG